MRDLSQISTSANSRPQRSNKLVKFIIIIIGVVAVGYFVKTQVKFGSGSSSTIVLEEAPRGLTPVQLEEKSVTSGGVDLTTQTAKLVDVKYGGEAKATATRSFGGETYKLLVEATLPDPKNVNYQVWLVGQGKPLPVNYMRGSKNTWSLNLRDTDKYSSYKEIWITLERSKDDIVEEHVMEGSF